LLYNGIINCDNLFISSLDTGVGVYNGLFHSTAIINPYTCLMEVTDEFTFLLGVIPVVSYSNADSDKNSRSAIKENKGKSGVYC
jgi:hypothetical protein